jgi:hypothetical protein
MEANPLRRVQAAKATLFVGLTMLMAVAALGIISAFSAAQQPPAQPAQAFGAKEVFDKPGPLPVTGTYTSKGGTLIIFASGSGWTGTPPQQIGMKVNVDGSAEPPNAEVFVKNAASANEHFAFVPASIVIKGQPAGPVPIELVRLNGQTQTDADDSFKVTVLEIPQ